jgi:hypothetical protein
MPNLNAVDRVLATEHFHLGAVRHRFQEAAEGGLANELRNLPVDNRLHRRPVMSGVPSPLAICHRPTLPFNSYTDGCKICLLQPTVRSWRVKSNVPRTRKNVTPSINAVSLGRYEEVGIQILQLFDFTLVVNRKAFRCDAQEFERALGENLMACRLLLAIKIAAD